MGVDPHPHAVLGAARPPEPDIAVGGRAALVGPARGPSAHRIMFVYERPEPDTRFVLTVPGEAPRRIPRWLAEAIWTGTVILSGDLPPAAAGNPTETKL